MLQAREGTDIDTAAARLSSRAARLCRSFRRLVVLAPARSRTGPMGSRDPDRVTCTRFGYPATGRSCAVRFPVLAARGLAGSEPGDAVSWSCRQALRRILMLVRSLRAGSRQVTYS